MPSQFLGAALSGWEGREAAVAGDLGGDALVCHALGARVVDQADVRVGVHVDEAGGHDLAGGVYDACGFGVREGSYRLDAVAGDADVGTVARCAGAVDYRAVAYEDVKLHCALP